MWGSANTLKRSRKKKYAREKVLSGFFSGPGNHVYPSPSPIRSAQIPQFLKQEKNPGEPYQSPLIPKHPIFYLKTIFKGERRGIAQ